MHAVFSIHIKMKSKY